MLTLVSTAEFALITARYELNELELIDAYRRFLDDEPSPDALWDLSNASLTLMSLCDIEHVALAFERLARGRRRRGRSAIVCPRALERGLAQAFVALIESARLPVAVRIFRRMDEAQAWLAEGTQQRDTAAPCATRGVEGRQRQLATEGGAS